MGLAEREKIVRGIQIQYAGTYSVTRTKHTEKEKDKEAKIRIKDIRKQGAYMEMYAATGERRSG